MRSLPFLGAVFTAISSALQAQTFVVDQANGPGASFTDLPPAIAAAPDGAILLVRPGTYGRIELIGKGLSILATGPGVVIYAPSEVPVLVDNIAAHQSVVLRGLTDMHSSVGAPVLTRCVLRNCSGHVLVDGFTSQVVGQVSDSQTQVLTAERCAQLTLRNCRLHGFEGLRTLDSVVVLESCQLSGQDTFWLPLGGSFPPGTGAVITGGAVTFARCQVRGGAGAHIILSQPAISAARAVIRLCEDSSGSYVAGLGFPNQAMAAIIGSASTVVRDPSANVQGTNGGSPVIAQVDIVRPLPSLRVVGAPPGGTLRADVTTPIGELVLLAVSFPGPVTNAPGVDGSWWLDPGSTVLQAFGVPAVGVPMTHSLAVPDNPALVGARFAWQALVWSALHGLRASNPSIYAH